MQLSNNLIVVDVETTGPNPFVHDVLAIAFVPVLRPERANLIYVRPPELTWTDFGLANFRKFEAEWRRLAMSVADAYDEIDSYLAELLPNDVATLVGHNVGFDLAFLRKLAHIGQQPSLPRISHRSIDTHTLLYLASVNHDWPSALSSDAAFELLHVMPEISERHTALGDAIATRQLFIKLMDALSIESRHPLRRSAR